MKIIFMGTPDFSVPSLQILIKNNCTISAVVTAPDKPRGRGQQLSITPVKAVALQHSLPVLQPETLRAPEFAEQLTSLKPDLLVIVAFRILPKEVYSIPSKGAFNLHASLLPKYRGAAPINWAIINGEKETGVTSFFLQEKVDTGNIILQKRIQIPRDMTAGILYTSLSEIGAETVLETVRLIESGKAIPTPQDNSIATPAPKIFKETCRIDWNGPAEKIRNFIRGLSPYPAAWTMLNGKGVKIFGAGHTEYRKQKTEQSKLIEIPGLLSVENGKQIFVKVLDGWIEINEIQQEGKKRLRAEEFLRGFRISGNEKFE